MSKIKSKDSNINENIQLIATQHFEQLTSEAEYTINAIYHKRQEILLELIVRRLLQNQQNADILDGFVFQKLLRSKEEIIKKQLYDHFPNGVVQLDSSLKINYQPLQDVLMNQKLEEADQLTSQYLCELANIGTKNRKDWLYFTDIQFIPKEDLYTLDLLWRVYSKGKFGFSVQKKIWISTNQTWEKLWEKIGWIHKSNGITKRYPNEFNWTLDAPNGHLPLSNQLRGTKTLLYLFNQIT